MWRGGGRGGEAEIHPEEKMGVALLSPLHSLPLPKATHITRSLSLSLTRLWFPRKPTPQTPRPEMCRTGVAHLGGPVPPNKSMFFRLFVDKGRWPVARRGRREATFSNSTPRFVCKNTDTHKWPLTKCVPTSYTGHILLRNMPC